MDYEMIFNRIESCSSDILRAMGAGMNESVYQNALVYDLMEDGLSVNKEVLVPHYYRSTMVGYGFIDLTVEGIPIELKKGSGVTRGAITQLASYLEAYPSVKYGLLVLFPSMFEGVDSDNLIKKKECRKVGGWNFVSTVEEEEVKVWVVNRSAGFTQFNGEVIV